MDVITTDILIIGSGAAGLAASVYAAESDLDILVIDKGAIGKSGSTVGAVQIARLQTILGSMLGLFEAISIFLKRRISWKN